MDPPVNQAEMPAILLHNISFTTGSIAHIYTKGRWTPPFETARALSQLYAFQWHQWVPIWNGQLIRKYKEIPVHIENI